jgi:hypothetical protein
MKTLFIAFIFLTSVACKVTTNPPQQDKKAFPPDTKVTKGESLGQHFFDATKAAATFNQLDGLWRSDTYTSEGVNQQQAWYFEGNQTLVLAQRCERSGVILYAMTRAPIQKVSSSRIQILESHAYVSTVNNPTLDEPLECTAYLQKSSFFYRVDGLSLCLSTGADCQGSQVLYEKIRDRVN